MAVSYETIPEIGVFSAYANGWTQLWKNFLMLILVAIVSLVVSIPAGISNGLSELGGYIAQQGDGAILVGGPLVALGFLFSLAYGILVISPMKYGVDYVYLRAARNNRLDIADMFEVFRNYLNAVMAAIIIGIITTIGFIFLIIPGIYLACKLAFTPYLIVDQRMSVFDALQESWDMTRGHVWRIIGIALMAIPITLMGLICFIVGIIPAVMWVQVAYASLYHAIDAREEMATETYYV